VAQHLTEEYFTASVKYVKTTAKLGTWDIGSDSKNNCDDFCGVLVPRTSKSGSKY
jgi:hypothetical protein